MNFYLIEYPIRISRIRNRNFMFIAQFPWKDRGLLSTTLSELLKEYDIGYTIPSDIDQLEVPIGTALARQHEQRRKVIYFLSSTSRTVKHYATITLISYKCYCQYLKQVDTIITTKLHKSKHLFTIHPR